MRTLPILFVVLLAFSPIGGSPAESDDTSPQSRALQVLAKLAPLPEDVPRTIQNPYHAEPSWKLWAVDPTPVTINKSSFKGTVQPVAQRQYPVFGLKRGVAELVLEPLGQTVWAGFWDDCYMSLDGDHTHLRQLKHQFIDAGQMRSAQDVETLLQLGVNFTSQSYADRGRAIVDDILNNLNTERHFFFANCIRATPAHSSYRDVDIDKVTDLYDGLFAHSYHSVGQSGSEMHALYKMMVAGACMPRKTKDLLKRHGAYAICLLTLFKAALPYTDAQGRVLPFEHELRHRPAYSSHGTPSHPHYCAANVHYHGYDDQRHLRAMMDLARGLISPPPVAVVRLLSLKVQPQNRGQQITREQVTQRVKGGALTHIRLWAQKGETLEARIDLNQSYDLQQRVLEFKCQRLYPHQRNVTVTEEEPGIFRIRCAYDPLLPKGRIPVICTARNGLGLPSNPVFVNFYWADSQERDDYMQMQGLPEDVKRQIKAMGLKRLPVTVNQRPVVDLGFAGDALRCLSGQTVSFDLKAHDPEGLPVVVYRRADELGTIRDGRYSVTLEPGQAPQIHRVHLVFSDGSGGYTGKQVKLLVSREIDPLPEPWAVTTLGPVHRVTDVRYEDGRFLFGKLPINRQTQPLDGTFVFQRLSSSADMACQISPISGGADLALVISNTLDGFSRRIALGAFQGTITGLIKPSENQRPETRYQKVGERWDNPVTVRLIKHDRVIAGYLSTVQQIWQQILLSEMDFFKPCYGGIIYRGEPWAENTCQWVPSSSISLPILQPNQKVSDRQGHYQAPLEVRVTHTDPNQTLRYTLDGSSPSSTSSVYASPLKLNDPARYEIHVGVFREDEKLACVKAAYIVTEP